MSASTDNAFPDYTYF